MKHFARDLFADNKSVFLSIAIVAILAGTVGIVLAAPLSTSSAMGFSERNDFVLSKIDTDILHQFKESEKQTVIVQLAEAGSGDKSIARGQIRLNALERVKDGILQGLASKNSPFRLVHRYSHFALMALELDEDSLDLIARRSDVVRIHANGFSFPSLESSLPYIGASEFHERDYSGTGVAVAILDTAVRFWNGHFGDCGEEGAFDAEGCSLAVWEDFIDDEIWDAHSVAAKSVHGSNVSGIVHGVAPDATLLGLNVFTWSEWERNWVAYDDSLLAALNWVAAHAEQYNIVSINMSLGSQRLNPRPCNLDSRFEAFKTLWEEHNVLSAVATGNDANHNALGEPACVTLAVSVGAHFDSDTSWVIGMDCADLYAVGGQLVCYTNRNGSMDIVAPGAWLTAGGFENLSGTSMAAPHVAGAIALLQDRHNQEMGSYLSASEVHKQLMMSATPLLFESYWYKRLNLFPEREVSWETSAVFPEFIKEMDEALIPSDPEVLAYTVEVEAEADKKAGGVYLQLEIIQVEPENVTVTLIAPDQSEVSLSLPKGVSNFNSVIGRHYLPAIFRALSASPLAGTWTLRLTDSGSDQDGYYLSAGLYFTAADCESNCEGLECGDNACGGVCGYCEDPLHCTEWSQCVGEEETCKGDSCEHPIELPFGSISISDSTLSCTYDERGSCGGGMAPERVYSFKIKRPTIFSARVSGFDTILYLRKGSCITGEIACNNDHEDMPEQGSRLDLELEKGKYFLFVDGYELAGEILGEYLLEIDMCAPDCRERDCGDDGCGGSCGDCEGEESICSDEGQCCTPDCTGLDCGDDGCGGSCGDCEEGNICADGGCVSSCEPDCYLEVPCEPDSLDCTGDLLVSCDDGGYDWILIEDCGKGLCDEGACLSPPDGDEDNGSDGDQDSPTPGSGSGSDSGSGCRGTGAPSVVILLLALLVGTLGRGRISLQR